MRLRMITGLMVLTWGCSGGGAGTQTPTEPEAPTSTAPPQTQAPTATQAPAPTGTPAGETSTQAGPPPTQAPPPTGTPAGQTPTVGGATPQPTPTDDAPTQGSSPVSFKGEAWADNWFNVYIEDQLIAEDSVPYQTERSFNNEVFTFSASYPFVLAFTLKDYKENDTGLEYIGEPNQQMGDGGFIFQLTDTGTGDIVHVSSSAWRCFVTHHAPVDKGCEKSATPETDCEAVITEEPSGWRAYAFDDSGWAQASVFTEQQVGPKDGYDTLTWDASAKLVWGPDLETDNTILCRAKVVAP